MRGAMVARDPLRARAGCAIWGSSALQNGGGARCNAQSGARAGMGAGDPARNGRGEKRVRWRCDMSEHPHIRLNNVDIAWDLGRGDLSFFGLDSVLFWTNPSMYRLLAPLVDE